MVTLQAVTFDLGGTLVEYERVPWEELEESGWRAMHAQLYARQRYLGTADEFAAAMMVESGRLWQRAIATAQSGALHEVFIQGAAALGILQPETEDFEQLSEHFHTATLDLVSVYDDSLSTLSALKQRGLKLALISNTIWPGRLHTKDLRRFALDPFFDVLTYSSETPHTKPHPRIFLDTLAQLGVVPEAAVHIGDRIVDDVQGAQRAGMKGVLKRHPRRIPEEGITPDATITHLHELPAVLDRLFAAA